jgi:hypothetical protein
MASSFGPAASSSPSPATPRLLQSKPLLVIVGVVAVAVVLVLVLLYGGISGISLNASSSSTGHTVTFQEMGLPSGTLWQVSLTPYVTPGLTLTRNSTSSLIQFHEPNGNYGFAVGMVTGYTATPRNGEVRVNGSDVSTLVSFSSVPLGSAFSWGIPVNASGTQTIGCGSPTTTYCYAIEIAGAGNGVSTSNVLLTLRNDAGATVPWSTQDTVSLISPTNASVVASYDPASQSWTLTPPFTGQFSSGDTILISTPATESAGLLGLQLVAVGTNGFSGTVPSVSFS